MTLVYFITRLVQKLGHINVFLELWARLFEEILCTGQIGIKLEGTPVYCIKVRPALVMFLAYE